MTETRLSMAKRIRLLCEAAPANGRVPNGITAADVATIASGFESMEFMVQSLSIERERIIRMIGEQVDGPDACLDGYPDLADLVADFEHSHRAQVAWANQQMWKREKAASTVEPAG